MKAAEPALHLELLRAELKAERRARAMAEHRLGEAYRQRLTACADAASDRPTVAPGRPAPARPVRLDPAEAVLPVLRDLRASLAAAQALAGLSPDVSGGEASAELTAELDHARLRLEQALELLQLDGATPAPADGTVHLGALLLALDDRAHARAESLAASWSMHLQLPLPAQAPGDAARWRHLLQHVVDAAIDSTPGRAPTPDRAPEASMQVQADASTLVLSGPCVTAAVAPARWAAASRLAGAVGGRLQLHAEGDRFELSLPLGLAAGPWLTERPAWDRCARAADAAAPPPPRLHGTVLLADGSSARRRRLRLLVQATGAAASEVDSGPALVEAALSGEHDLLLVAGSLPGLDGASAAHVLRQAGYGGVIVGHGRWRPALPDDIAGAATCDARWDDPDDHVALLQLLGRLLPPAASAGSTAADSAWLDALMVRLADDFCRDWPQRQAELRAACTQRDGPALQRLAHRIRGVAGSIGFMHLSTLAEPVQRLAEDGRIDDAIEHAARLIDATPRHPQADPGTT